MTNSAFDKMLFGTAWGPLDVLVVDMPPGACCLGRRGHTCGVVSYGGGHRIGMCFAPLMQSALVDLPPGIRTG